jgi:hypothetical protein
MKPNGKLDLGKVQAVGLMRRVCWHCSRMEPRSFETCRHCERDQPIVIWFGSGARAGDKCVAMIASHAPFEGSAEVAAADEEIRHRLAFSAETLRQKLSLVPPEDWT